ncbi:MAG: hypothetical protein ACKOEI_13115, partial [Chthoniobacterales bacterium]
QTALSGSRYSKPPALPEVSDSVFDTSLYAVLLRGIGILPMISSNHGQDARATFLQNRGDRCKELRRKRSKP